MGPRTLIGKEIFREKYAKPGEDWRALVNRVACALKDDDEHYHALRSLLGGMRFLPGGRITANAGTGATKSSCLNCFVAAPITDSFEGIMASLTRTGLTLRSGGGVGTDFSTLRPRGAPVRGLGPGATASGPVSFMELWDAMGKTIHAAGNRRGAQLGSLDISHPDTLEFITAKHTPGRLTQFNLSLWVPDKFMSRVVSGGKWQFNWQGSAGEVDARSLWETILRSTYDHAEPGILFRDTITRRDPLSYAQRVVTTNPCGEIFLPANGACLLGSFVLPKYIFRDHGTAQLSFNWSQFWQDISVAYRALDNVIEHTYYPLDDQMEEMMGKRRLGIGITGLANAGEALGHSYGSYEFLDFTHRIYDFLRNRLYSLSTERARQRGSFPLFSASKHLSMEYINELPVKIQGDIKERGLRNSHLLATAPAGTMSLLADNVSSGIEPTFSKRLVRTIRTEDGEREAELIDYGVAEWGTEPRTAQDCSVEDHLEVLEIAARACDLNVSKTVNVPSGTTWDQFKDIYMSAWKRGIKSLSTFSIDGQRKGILEPTSCSIEGGCE